jgi:hypothetical protein
MIVIPLIAIPIALVIQQVRAARFLFVPLLAVSFVFAAVAMNDFQGLYPVGDKPRMFGLRTTAAAFPLVGQSREAASFTLTPSLAPRQTGKLSGPGVVAKAGRDGPGFLFWGPYVPLRAGTYRASFPLGISGVADKVPVARIEAAGAPPGRSFAAKVLTAGEIRSHGRRPVTLDFKTPGQYLVETRLYYDGLGTLTAGPVDVRALRAPVPARLSARTLEGLWIGGTIVIGWLFVELMRRSRRPAPEKRPEAGTA